MDQRLFREEIMGIEKTILSQSSPVHPRVRGLN